MALIHPALANTLWLASSLPEWRRFQIAAGRVEQTQARLLAHYLRANRRTAFGRRHHFAAIDSVEAYQKAVPLTTYEDYVSAIDDIGRGQPGVLTNEAVRLFELSSGSVSASKLIPYTRSLQAEFQRGLAAWVVDLYARRPQLIGGPAYWSITPLTDGPRAAPGGLPIGFEEDSAYLGALGQVLARSSLAVPSLVKQVRNAATFRYVTLLYLLRQPDLRLISVWHPSFLSLLLAPLAGWWESLLDDLAHGRLTPPGELDPGLHQSLAAPLRPQPARARALWQLPPDDYRAIWPSLRLISCWADGPAARAAQQLAVTFPGVELQPKGLLATEAFVSFPHSGRSGSLLSVRSHFFEFLPADPDEDGPPRLAHQLRAGETYSVVVTTGGGFYRYRLRDLVEVTGHERQVPRLRFVGKGDRVSDWFGEKLDERFVAQALDEVCAAHGLAPVFMLLAPDDPPEGFRYVLFLELTPGAGWAGAQDFAADLDRVLRQNFHYAYCRKLGQLAPAEVVQVEQGAAQAYLGACQARGQKLGGIKPAVLQTTTGWRHHFQQYAEVTR